MLGYGDNNMEIDCYGVTLIPTAETSYLVV